MWFPAMHLQGQQAERTRKLSSRRLRISLPSGEVYILLWDFNARVGSRESVEQWTGVRGPHGYGVTNDAGRELLSFLSSHQATVCNTWFEKKDIHKQTWQHPKSKLWSCIYLVVMRERNRGICIGVSAKRGAVSNTDHHLVCAKLRLRGVRYGKRRGSRAKDKRFDVEKMAISKDGESAVRDEYLQKWLAIQSALVTTAEDVLRRAGRSQPDRFRDAMQELKPSSTSGM